MQYISTYGAIHRIQMSLKLNIAYTLLKYLMVLSLADITFLQLQLFSDMSAEIGDNGKSFPLKLNNADNTCIQKVNQLHALIYYVLKKLCFIFNL